MSALGLGCVKTKSGRVFTQPGSDSVIRRCRPNVRFAPKRTRLGDLWARKYRVETEGFLSTLVTVTPNFALLEMSHPEVASLVAAMLQARDAVERRSWSHPQEPTGEEWWADVLADPRARKRERRTDLAVIRSHPGNTGRIGAPAAGCDHSFWDCDTLPESPALLLFGRGSRPILVAS
jgi:hypothetical protein